MTRINVLVVYRPGAVLPWFYMRDTPFNFDLVKQWLEDNLQ